MIKCLALILLSNKTLFQRHDIERQKQILEEYEALSVYDNLNDVEAISTDWLSSWLENKTEIEKEIDNSKLKCSHDKLDPWALTHAKYVSSAAVRLFYDYNQYLFIG